MRARWGIKAITTAWEASVNVFVNSFLLVYAALFPIVNPFGSAPLFLGLTESYGNTERAPP